MGNARICPQCGHRFSGMVKALTFFIGLMVVIIVISFHNPPGRIDYLPPAPPSLAGVTPAVVPPQTPAQKIAIRRAYAKVIDQQLLDLGIESKTHTSGADAKSLVIEDVLAGRVRQNAIERNADLFDNLRSLGFTHLRYTNNLEGDLGYGVTWTIEQ